MLEFTVNVKQAIAFIWTLIAIVLSLIVVLTIGYPYLSYLYPYSGYAAVPWQLLVGLFFGLLLITTLPIYLLMVLWQALAKSETS
jgi:vacuolar-type H+-ATPase subunit I/STV1